MHMQAVGMANDHHIFVSLGHDPGAETIMTMAVDNGFDRLITEGPYRLEQLFAVFLGVAGIEND